MFNRTANEIEGLGVEGEITFRLRDKNVSIKPLWNEKAVGKRIRRFFARLALLTDFRFDSLNRLGENGIRISLFGAFSDAMVVKNTVTNVGFAAMASRCNGAGGENAFTYLAVGTNSTAAAAGNTALGAEIVDSGLARAAATCTRVTTTQTNDTAQLDKTFTITGTKSVTEAGAFNAASSGILLGRQVFTGIAVESGDSLQITYKFKFS